VGEFTFGVSDGTTGAIDYGWHTFPEGPTRDSGGTPLSYGGKPILVRFEKAGAPVPLSGAVDAAHGDFSFTFGGRLRFRPENFVAGFGQCVTPYFTVTVTASEGFPPGTNFVDQIDLDGVLMSTGTVAVNGSVCDSAAASAINSTFGLGSPTTFYLWKARFYPEMEGSY
jgi:hypothetical protein